VRLDRHTSRKRKNRHTAYHSRHAHKPLIHSLHARMSGVFL
jgi:hypothetical protein